MLVKSREHRFSHLGDVYVYCRGLKLQGLVFSLPSMELSLTVIRCDFKYKLES